jgi:hypothetical protein
VIETKQDQQTVAVADESCEVELKTIRTLYADGLTVVMKLLRHCTSSAPLM